MIEAISYERMHEFPGVLESMYRLRHRIFVDRLGWKLKCEDGLESDQFDTAGTVYLVLRNPENEVVASCRLLPSDGPNVLADVFPFLCADGVPTGPTIWEASRLSVDHRRDQQESVPDVDNVTGTLLCGIMEFAMTIGLTHLVSVSDVRLERIIRRTGWNPRRLGPPVDVSGLMVCGEIAEVSASALHNIRRMTGVNRLVLASPDLGLRHAA